MTGSYKQLVLSRGLGALLAASMLARLASQLWSFSLIVFVALKYPPSWVGIIAFADLAPAIIIGPFTGAILDRSSRRSLIACDAAISAAGCPAVVLCRHLTSNPLPLVLRPINS